MDELYALIIFEAKMRDMMSTIVPYQFSFSTTEPGLSSDIGPLEQNYVMLQNYLSEDPDIDYYKEVA